ncbi:MAG: nuclear transport factor 2 family protein [Betaproteobacteria bacterium]|nr:nuclear transport factor 2 family protein [Betaproteobacteria bacterium]
MRLILFTLAALLGACTTLPAPVDALRLKQEVLATERAFAKTMADRDHQAFATFIADEAIFFSSTKPLRGKTEVAQTWARYYEKPTAPFSWEPDEVEVLEGGTLALSSGPVRNAEGKLIARFTLGTSD